jgi:hypothetical protein
MSQQRARDALDLVAVTTHQGACHATQAVPTAGPFRTARARINLWHDLVDIVAVETVIAPLGPQAFNFRLAAGHAHHDLGAVGAWEAAEHKFQIAALRYWPVPMLNSLG